MNGGGLGWPVGRVAGVQVYLARSWLVIALVVVVTFGPQVERIRPGLGLLAYAVALIYALGLLLSVLVHELAHAVSAKAAGMQVHHIALTLWGGHTQFSTEDPRPGSSFLVAAAGPASNLVLAGVGYVAALLTGDLRLVSALCSGFFYVNAFVGVFNLIPGLPLDGGAMLEAAVWKVTGNRSRGTRLAAYIGLVAAAAVVVCALWPVFGGETLSTVNVVWGVLIAGMLFSSARQALAVADLRQRVAQVGLSTLLQPARVWPGRSDARQLVGSFERYPGLLLFADDDHGRVVGVVQPQALAAAAANPSPVPLSAVCTAFPGDRVVPVQAGAEAALTAIQGDPSLPVLVSYPDQGVVGYLTLDRLAAAMQSARPARL